MSRPYLQVNRFRQLKHPIPFMTANSNIPMNNPDEKTAANTPAPAPDIIPIEKLVDSMKPEKPLIIPGTTAAFGAASGMTGGASSTSSAPGQP